MTPAGSGLRWWEAAAGACLLADRLRADRRGGPAGDSAPGECGGDRDAYFPWIGALHVLLDSLIDQPEDLQARPPQPDRPLLLGRGGRDAAGLRSLRVPCAAWSNLPHSSAHHATILAAMASFYLSDPANNGARERRPAAKLILETMGGLGDAYDGRDRSAARHRQNARRRREHPCTFHYTLESQVLDFPLARGASRREHGRA